MTTEIDTHDPAGMSAYLRQRARVNRELADMPVDQWPRFPGVARHVALRLDQAADMIDRLYEDLIRAQNRVAVLAVLLYGPRPHSAECASVLSPAMTPVGCDCGIEHGNLADQIQNAKRAVEAWPQDVRRALGITS